MYSQYLIRTGSMSRVSNQDHFWDKFRYRRRGISCRDVDDTFRQASVFNTEEARSKKEGDQGLGVGGSEGISDSEDACKGSFFAVPCDALYRWHMPWDERQMSSSCLFFTRGLLESLYLAYSYPYPYLVRPIQMFRSWC